MNKKIALILVIIFCINVSFFKSQNRVLDSLDAIFLMSNDTNKVLILSRISRLISSNNPQKAEIIADSALKFSEKINYLNGIAHSYDALANAQNTIGKYDEAIINLLKAVDVYIELQNKKDNVEWITKGLNFILNDVTKKSYKRQTIKKNKHIIALKKWEMRYAYYKRSTGLYANIISTHFGFIF